VPWAGGSLTVSADEPDFTQYDRAAAARILTEVLADAVLRPDGWLPDSPSRIEPHLTPLEPASGSHLTTPQLNYLRSRMRPCPAELVTSATHRVMWNDSDGVVNVAHCGPGRLGAVVPVIARETTLVLRRALAADSATRAAADGLSAGERATMAATTTDRDPLEILNVGLETTARALVQHAYLAEQTPYRGPAEFARGLRDSGLFAVVANTWFWGLQSSTFRRGMSPVALTARADGTVRYTTESTTMLRAMKDATIADAHTVLAAAMAEEGLSVGDAIRKYDLEEERVSRQYALLPAGEQSRCPANMPATVAGRRGTLLPGVVDTFVESFVRLLKLVEVTGAPDQEETAMSSPVDEVFEVPDMTCSHCTNTVTKVLQTNGVTVSQIDLDTKKVVAAFPSADVRERCFDAIRDRGYTVIRPMPGTKRPA